MRARTTFALGGLLAVGLVVGRYAARRGQPVVAGETPRAAPPAQVAGGEQTDAPEPFERELAAALERERALAERVAELEEVLADERARRRDREQEWLEFTRALSALPLPGASPAPPGFLELPPEAQAAVEEAAGPSAEERAAAERAQRRSAAVRSELRALLAAEQVLALDVLEVGAVQEGWTGPVVIRLLDDRGRPAGFLVAERLRLEVSRAGRSVTLVLEEGAERHGEVTVPFGPPETPGAGRGGLRRIHLPEVDPGPWLEALPELVDPEARRPVPDDGLWNLIELRLRLDGLLRDDPSGGHWRLRGIGGVQGDVIYDVQLVELDDAGRTLRRLFADRLTVRPGSRGLVLLLEEGVQVRQGLTAPFLEGRYRVFLPRARRERWAAAGVPGLSLPPQR